MKRSVTTAMRFGAEGIRVASAVDSPIVGVRIGNIDDRFSEGGIKPKIEEIVDRGLAAQIRAVCIKTGIVGPGKDLPEMFS